MALITAESRGSWKPVLSPEMNSPQSADSNADEASRVGRVCLLDALVSKKNGSNRS